VIETGEMSTTDEIAAFYAARLDEEEAAAKAMVAAFEGVADWVIRENGGEFDFTVTAGQLATEAVADMWREDAAAWIARHDPARALRKVRAGRKLILRYRVAMGVREEDFDPTVTALVGQMRDEVTVWDDHPDYQELWKP
jgi:hypothetical protein